MPASPLQDHARALAARDFALPRPGSGATLARWEALARIAAEDVCLAKVLEAHYDAVAILQDLGGPVAQPGQLWAVWAAEPPDAMVRLRATAQGWVADGDKAWCSGADLVTHALVTARDGERRQLVAVALRAPGLSEPARAWPAVGMSRVVSGALRFDAVPVEPVGAADAYLQRPGFWHGGGGIAACWFGAAAAIAEVLRTGPRKSAHALAALGRVDMALHAAASMLRELAACIDAAPDQAHATAVTRARCVVERACVEILDRVNRVLGPGPLCADAAHALRCADLAVFIRQNHAERDWEQLGQAAAEAGGWSLAKP
jgi:alkylation response protein AidB-like acyl-CoA dehydrogenase